MMYKNYRTGELLEYLGVTRDTLRFYEEKGLLKPQKCSDNNYRNYDIMDIYNIMILDFYKKRGMSINQLQELIKDSNLDDIKRKLQNKKSDLEKKIFDLQCMKKKIEDTQTFIDEVMSNIGVFSIRPLPLYRVKGELSDFIAVEEYKNVLEVFNSKNDDMLSQILRYISFDDTGVKSTKMLIADTAETDDERTPELLQYPKCLYTVELETQPNIRQEDLMVRMHKTSAEQAQLLGLRLTGEAFAMIRFITYHEMETRSYIEIFVPFY